MTYRKPTCNCGEELVYSTEIVFLVEKTISKTGRMSKRVKKTNVSELGVYDSIGLPIEKLACKKCFSRYVCEYDDKNRVIRGKVI